MDIALYPFFLHNHFTPGLAPCTLLRWEGLCCRSSQLCSRPLPWGKCPCIPEDPNYKLAFLRCDTTGTIHVSLWSGSCEDAYSMTPCPALPCPVTLIPISGGSWASKGFSGSCFKPDCVENRILLALHPVPPQNLKLNSQLKLKLELLLEKPAAPCLCSHPALCCSDWDYFTSTSERIFQSREEQTKIKQNRASSWELVHVRKRDTCNKVTIYP